MLHRLRKAELTEAWIAYAFSYFQLLISFFCCSSSLSLISSFDFIQVRSCLMLAIGQFFERILSICLLYCSSHADNPQMMMWWWWWWWWWWWCGGQWWWCWWRLQVAAVVHEAAMCSLSEGIHSGNMSTCVSSRHFDTALTAVRPRITDDQLKFYTDYASERSKHLWYVQFLSTARMI